MNKSVAKRLFWMCFTLGLSILTIWTLLKQSQSMSIARLLELIIKADKKWMLAAIISSFMYVVFEAVAICSILKGISYKRHLSKGLIYSTSDVYFSAITPSATGGQPASAYFMIRDGLPAGVTSATLILNLVMYNASIVFLGILAIILAPKTFLSFKLTSKILIILGFVGLSLLAIFFMFTLHGGDKVFSLIQNFLKFLHSKKLIRKLDSKLLKLEKIEKDYKNCSTLIAGKSRIMIKALLWNCLQRASQIIVPALVYISMGGFRGNIIELFSKQCLITIGYNYVPIPGALGIADYLMIDGFSSIMTKNAAFELDMISRGLTFYICVTLSGLITLIGYLKGKRGNDRSL